MDASAHPRRIPRLLYAYRWSALRRSLYSGSGMDAGFSILSGIVVKLTSPVASSTCQMQNGPYSALGYGPLINSTNIAGMGVWSLDRQQDGTCGPFKSVLVRFASTTASMSESSPHPWIISVIPPGLWILVPILGTVVPLLGTV